MYQKQEEFDHEKKQQKQAVIQFQDEEEKLRAHDIRIQNSMIKFSTILQKNLKKQEAAIAKIKAENKLKMEKEKEKAKKEDEQEDNKK